MNLSQQGGTNRNRVLSNSFSAEFKATVVSDAIKLGPSEAAQHWSVPRTTVGSWKKLHMNQLCEEDSVCDLYDEESDCPKNIVQKKPQTNSHNNQ